MNRSPSNAIFFTHNSLPLTFASAKQYGNFLLHSILSQCIFTGSNQFRPPLPWLWLFYLHFAKSYVLSMIYYMSSKSNWQLHPISYKYWTYDEISNYLISFGLLLKQIANKPVQNHWQNACRGYFKPRWTNLFRLLEKFSHNMVQFASVETMYRL